MSISVIKTNICNLKKIHPFILKNDVIINNRFIDENQRIKKNRRMPLFISSPTKNINIKKLISNNLEKITEIKSSNDKVVKSKILPDINSKIFEEEFEFKKSNFNSIFKTYRKNTKNNNYRKEIAKIDYSTKFSTEPNKLNSNKSIKNSKMNIFLEKNNNILSKPKIFKIKNNKTPFKDNFLSKTIYKENNEKNSDFITNVGTLKLNNMKLNSVYSKTSNNILKKFSFKKDKSIESLDDNSIWNDYTRLEKYKSEEKLKKKKKVKDEILNMVNMFKNSYNFKRGKIEDNKNVKEKYLYFLEDCSLALRLNILKNNIHDERGGKQSKRLIYDPLNT